MKPGDFNIKGDSWNENSFTPFKTLRICAQMAWWASIVFWTVKSDIVLSNGNDIVIDPGVVAAGSLAGALGTPATLWRNDARLLWNQGMNPVLLSALMPNMTDQSLVNNGGFLNIPVQSNPTSVNPTNNLQSILNNCYQIKTTKITPTGKIAMALELGNIMSQLQQNKKPHWLDFTPQGKTYQDWGPNQLKFITQSICKAKNQNIIDPSDIEITYNQMMCS